MWLIWAEKQPDILFGKEWRRSRAAPPASGQQHRAARASQYRFRFAVIRAAPRYPDSLPSAPDANGWATDVQRPL